MLAEPRGFLLVANLAAEHLGGHLVGAAHSCGIELRSEDTQQAWSGPPWLRRLSYHCAGKRPPALGAFSARVLAQCRASPPSMLLSTGIAPLHARALRAIRALGTRCINFLTDDPWNPANRTEFFWQALKEYDIVYSPRVANLSDLRAHGCRDVRYLPFGYNPHVHFPLVELTDTERARYACDVAFVGAADADRVRCLEPLLRADLKARLYGGYWGRFPSTRAFDHGIVFEHALRASVAGAKVNLCMGRAANRDGHAMRTFELPAMRACMLVEDTAEHREIFGEDDACVAYYRGSAELVLQARSLSADPGRRARLADAVFTRIAGGGHTYADRLQTIVRGV